MATDPGFLNFSHVQFHSVFDLQQVWSDRPAGHLPLHESALRRFRNSLEHSRHLPGPANPLGLCFIGPAGSGKTHLLGEIRREAAHQQANFVLSDLTDIREFWPLLAMHYMKSLQKPMNGVKQIERIMEVLRSRVENWLGNFDILAFCALPRKDLVDFASNLIKALRPVYGEDIMSRHKVLRAMLYQESNDFDLIDRASSFLQGIEQIDDESKEIGLGGNNSAKNAAADLAWFFGLCGPTVLAFDQLDPFIAQNNLAAMEDNASPKQKEALQIMFQFVNGVMAIREEFPRTLILVSCLETSWNVLQKRAVSSFTDRFEPVETLRAIREAGAPAELIGLRLDEAYRSAEFTPPYRAWPFSPGFFTSLPVGLTPREILNRAEKHRLDCVVAGEVIELQSYLPTAVAIPVSDVSRLDDMFAEERLRIDPGNLLDESAEDALGDLLYEAGCLFRSELPLDPNVDLVVENDFQETKQYKSLHVRLRRIFRIEGDREEHVCLRVLQKNQAYPFQVRLRAALTTSGMSEQLDGRRLVLLRNLPPPTGPKTADMVRHTAECGAVFLTMPAEDVRTLSAVVSLSKTGDSSFETWLLRNTPLSKTSLFQQLVPGWFEAPAATPQPVRKKSTPVKAAAAVASTVAQILLGSKMEAGSTGDAVYLPLAELTRHVVLRAGSGGGKTVFIKRLVEEAALRGVPSIVIDTAKDLSLLGDRWTRPPAGWTASDADLAELYHTNVDVQIWTPGHAGGRAMRLAPLPNLSGPFAEPHDRDQAIEIAVSGLLPLAVQKKNTTVERAILKKVIEWLTHQPQHDGNELTKLIAALRDLPGEAFQGYQNERKLAGGMADQIQAALVGDPLYGGNGEDLDPAVLFGVDAPRTRISVLSLFALNDVTTQARFIGQLSSALFNWIRRTPAPAGSLIRGLLVLDEAALFLPRKNAESKPGLMLLARQARKYGLGLVLATQNPMDLDYNATANFATQLFGAANTPQVVKFIQEAMEQRGLSGLNPGQLKAGQFFCATPSIDRPVKLQAAMCLSAHPQNTQLSDDEILARARSSGGKSDLGRALGSS